MGDIVEIAKEEAEAFISKPIDPSEFEKLVKVMEKFHEKWLILCFKPKLNEAHLISVAFS